MKLEHTTPCRECPWRRKAPAGYLGGHDVADYANLGRFQVPTTCHLTVREGREPALCAGMAQMLNNSHSRPRDREYAAEVDKAGANPDVFKFVSEFEAHHAEANARFQARMRREG